MGKSRKTTAGSTGSEKPVTPPVSKSPVRRASPTRKMPARRASPARKSPSRKSPSRKSPARPKRGLTRNKFSTDSEEARLTPNDLSQKSPSKSENKAEKASSVQSVSTSHSSSTVMTTKITETITVGGLKSEDTSGDSEIAKLTSIGSFVRRSLSKNLTPSISTHHLTPTPTTEQSQSRNSRSVSRSIFDEEDNYSKTEYSENEDEEEHYQSFHADMNRNSYGKNITGRVSLLRNVPSLKGIIRSLSAIFILLIIPCITVYLQWSCDKRSSGSCSFKRIDITNVTLEKVKKFFNLEAIGIYLLFVSGNFILSSLPIGRIFTLYNDSGSIKYYFTAIASSLIATTGLIIGEWLKYSVANFISNNYIRLCVFTQLSAFIIAFWCFIRSRYVPVNKWNPYSKTGNFVIDFCLGREISPRWFGVIDIKLASYRASLIATLLLAEVFIYKNLTIPKFPVPKQGGPDLTYLEIVDYFYKNTQYDLTALVTACMLLLYVLDWIYYEHHLAASFELQQEGVGAVLLLRYASTPFLLAALPKYYLEFKPVNFNCIWFYVIPIYLFLMGQFIKRASNSIKYRYRMNPNQHDLLMIDTVPTFQGKRLLLGRYWGTVRQPNYAGDILALLSFFTPLYNKFAWPPLVSLLIVIILLVLHTLRVNARNSVKYNSAWIRYCTRVPYLLVPKIF